MKNAKSNVLSRLGHKIAMVTDRLLLATPLVGDWVRFSRGINRALDTPTMYTLKQLVHGDISLEDVVGKGNVRPDNSGGRTSWSWWGW